MPLFEEPFETALHFISYLVDRLSLIIPWKETRIYRNTYELFVLRRSVLTETIRRTGLHRKLSASLRRLSSRYKEITIAENQPIESFLE